MKLQYLGDSKDAFKWDYLDFFVDQIKAPCLDVVPMWTLDDASNQGSTSPTLFPATGGVTEFCRHLKGNKFLVELKKLPQYTGKNYAVRMHKPNIEFQDNAIFRSQYFSDIHIKNDRRGVLFLDPDIGFEAPKTVSKKHIKYSDIATIWQNTGDETIVVVFQHARQKHCPFQDHYQEILRGLRNIQPLYSTAIYWSNKLMFVLLGKSFDQIGKARDINEAYRKKNRPVQMINNRVPS